MSNNTLAIVAAMLNAGATSEQIKAVIGMTNPGDAVVARRTVEPADMQPEPKRAAPVRQMGHRVVYEPTKAGLGKNAESKLAGTNPVMMLRMVIKRPGRSKRDYMDLMHWTLKQTESAIYACQVAGVVRSVESK